MKVPECCDVLVIGGGPGGSLGATYLAQKGHNVVLMDKQRHPRYAVGESLLPDFWKYTDAAGCSDRIAADGFIEKAGGTVIWNGNISGVAFKNFGYTRPALHVERDRFDLILFENARDKGVEIFEEVGVSSVNFQDPNNPVVHYRKKEGASGQIDCRYVIDASGQSALLGRQLGLRSIDTDFRFMSVWGYYKDSKFVSYGGSAHPFENMKHTPPTTFVTSLDQIGEGAWAWHIPQRKLTSVGLILPSYRLKAYKAEDEDWEVCFRRICGQVPNLSQLLAEATFVPDSVRLTRDYSYRSRRVCGPGYYLVGDAAGFVDPIFSVGVLLAMYGAYAAAWAINTSLSTPGLASRMLVVYEHQLQGKNELARSLALPQYQSEKGISDLAKANARSVSRDAQDLMRVVSGLTSRSDNYSALAGNDVSAALSDEKMLKIDKIDFG